MKVRIFKPSRSTMQSGLGKTQKWVLESEPVTKRTLEPLMNWSQSDDTLNQIKLSFPSREAAIAHAQKQGWEYSVAPERVKKIRPRNYMDNFRYIPSEEDRV